MSTGSTIAISDTSRAILELEGEVSNFDSDIRAKVAELLKVQQELSRMVTHRDALIATFKQISDYRYDHVA